MLLAALSSLLPSCLKRKSIDNRETSLQMLGIPLLETDRKISHEKNHACGVNESMFVKSGPI